MASAPTGAPQLPSDLAQAPPTATPGFPSTTPPPTISQADMGYAAATAPAPTDPNSLPPAYAGTSYPAPTAGYDPAAMTPPNAGYPAAMTPQQGYYTDPAATAATMTAPAAAGSAGWNTDYSAAAPGSVPTDPAVAYAAPPPGTWTDPNATAGAYPQATSAVAPAGATTAPAAGSAVYQADARSAPGYASDGWSQDPYPAAANVTAPSPGQFTPGATGYAPPAYQTAPAYETPVTTAPGAVSALPPAPTSPGVPTAVPRPYRPGGTRDYVPGATRLNALPTTGGVTPAVFEATAPPAACPQGTCPDGNCAHANPGAGS